MGVVSHWRRLSSFRPRHQGHDPDAPLPVTDGGQIHCRACLDSRYASKWAYGVRAWPVWSGGSERVPEELALGRAFLSLMGRH